MADTEPTRFPPDAPVVPNDEWLTKGLPAVPPKCPKAPDGRHRWNRPDPALARQECLWCPAERYTVPSQKW